MIILCYHDIHSASFSRFETEEEMKAFCHRYIRGKVVLLRRLPRLQPLMISEKHTNSSFHDLFRGYCRNRFLYRKLPFRKIKEVYRSLGIDHYLVKDFPQEMRG